MSSKIGEKDIMMNKKNLYEILGIPATATRQEILTAHQGRLSELQAEEVHLTSEELNLKLKLLNQALETLSDPQRRREYDQNIDLRPIPPDTSPGRHELSLVEEAAPLSQRADALALRADALSLRADALAIKADISGPGVYQREVPFKSDIAKGVSTTLRSMLMVIGALAVLSMLGKSAVTYYAAKKAADRAAAAAKAEEQMIIQEYYRKHGVRPASADEARMLEQEQRRKEQAERDAEYDRQRQEREIRRLQEESRRIGDQVSADLRRAEEAAKREDAYKKLQQEEQERRRQREEEERLERERQKWREVLSR